MKTKSLNSRKRGLSSVVGSLILVVITIVAALLLGHFVFGLFSSNSHNAAVTISDVNVAIPGGNPKSPAYVTLSVTDSGNDPVTINTISVDGSQLYPTATTGATGSLNASGTTGTTIKIQPGQTVTFTGTINANTYQVGQTVEFTVTATDVNTGTSIATQTSTVVQD